MDELNLLKRMERVKAPPDFEEKVLAQLSLRRKINLKARRLRFSLAGAFSAALVLLIILNVSIIWKKNPVERADLERGLYRDFQRGEGLAGVTVPIMEAVDYRGEIKTRSPEPRTIYILEQVVEGSSNEIKY